LFWFIDEFLSFFEKIIYSAIIVDFYPLCVLSHTLFPYITTLLFISVLYSVFKVRSVFCGTSFLEAALKFRKAAAFRNFFAVSP